MKSAYFLLSVCAGWFSLAFGPTQAYYYWSATALAGDPTIAWLVNFGVGSVDIGDKVLDFYARAVRSRP